MLYNWAEVRATSVDEKIDALNRGRSAAARALMVQPSNARAHFWRAVNAARWGELRGMAASLSVLGEIRREARTVLELDPKFAPGYTLAGSVVRGGPARCSAATCSARRRSSGRASTSTPGSRACASGWRRSCTHRPRAEGREELQRVVAEAEPANLADWTMKDAPEARALLERWQ